MRRAARSPPAPTPRPPHPRLKFKNKLATSMVCVRDLSLSITGRTGKYKFSALDGVLTMAPAEEGGRPLSI